MEFANVPDFTPPARIVAANPSPATPRPTTRDTRKPLPVRAARGVGRGVLPPRPERADERALIARAKQATDHQARNELIEAHMGLVRQVARRYAIDASHYEDILQEGALGVLRAAETFDLAFDVRFSTYATYWIRTRIQRYLAAVRSHEYGAPASVAWACGKTRGKSGFRALARSLSLEDTAGPDGERTLEEVVAADMPDPEAKVGDRELHGRVVAALRRAAERLDDPRTKLIIEERLLAEEPATLAELGQALNLSREGARLLETRLLKETKKELDAVGVAA
jgi:RNA polymerase sigma-32 factor